MHDRARASAIMIVNAGAKTSSIVPVITTVCELTRREVMRGEKELECARSCDNDCNHDTGHEQEIGFDWACQCDGA
jgi:hypothetical protein